jgi:lipoprotein Spr
MRVDYAASARALVGAWFRPQGRDFRTGLDCVGLVLATFDIVDHAIRRNYRLRGDHRAEMEARLKFHFQRVRSCNRHPGDVLLLVVASNQFHLAVQTDRGFVHADAKQGRVIETPGDPKWPIAGTFRKRGRARAGD